MTMPLSEGKGCGQREILVCIEEEHFLSSARAQISATGDLCLYTSRAFTAMGSD